MKKFDTRLARPTGLSVREHIKQLKVSPLTPLKGASDALCRAYIDAYEHARFGCKVNFPHLIIHLIFVSAFMRLGRLLDVGFPWP